MALSEGRDELEQAHDESVKKAEQRVMGELAVVESESGGAHDPRGSHKDYLLSKRIPGALVT